MLNPRPFLPRVVSFPSKHSLHFVCFSFMPISLMSSLMNIGHPETETRFNLSFSYLLKLVSLLISCEKKFLSETIDTNPIWFSHSTLPFEFFLLIDSPVTILGLFPISQNESLPIMVSFTVLYIKLLILIVLHGVWSTLSVFLTDISNIGLVGLSFLKDIYVSLIFLKWFPVNSHYLLCL